MQFNVKDPFQIYQMVDRALSIYLRTAYKWKEAKNTHFGIKALSSPLSAHLLTRNQQL
jgi:hypothetical protein